MATANAMFNMHGGAISCKCNIDCVTYLRHVCQLLARLCTSAHHKG